MSLMTNSERSPSIPRWVRCADATTVVIVVVACIVFGTGGFHATVAGVWLSATSGSRILLCALLVAGFRHLVFRRPTLLDRIARLFSARFATARPRVRSTSIPGWVRYADGATIAILGLAFAVFVTGGFGARVAGVKISVTSGSRVVFWALLVAGFRHLIFLGPTLLDRIARVFPSATVAPLIQRETTAGAATARPTAREIIFVVVLMAVLAVAMTYPQVRRLDSLPDPGDPLFSCWRLAWIAHQVVHDPLHLFDGNIFYPERNTLALSDSIVFPGVVGAPFLWLGAPLVHFYNIYLIATFALAAIAMYLFVRAITGEPAAALVAAVIFGFYPFRVEHYPHFELQFSFWMPLALWALHRTFERGRIRDGLLTGAAVAGQTLSSLYFGVYLVTYLVPISVVLGLGWQRFRATVKPLVAGGCLAAVLVTPMVVPYLQARRTFGERSAGEVEFYSARPQHYLTAHETRSPYGHILGRKHEGERDLFPGFVAIAAALLAMWPPLSVVRIAYIIGLVFAFDASLGSHGAVYSFLYTWVLAYHGLRVPARFSMLTGLSLAILAGFAVARLSRRLPRRPVKYAVAATLCAMVLAECRPMLALEPAPQVPSVYQWFVGRAGTKVAVLPPGNKDEPWRRECAYMYFSTIGWPRLLNGNSGVLPKSYWEFNGAMASFPDDGSMRLLRERGVEYVVLHEEFYGADAYKRVVEAVEGRADLAEVVRAWSGGNASRIYQVVR